MVLYYDMIRIDTKYCILNSVYCVLYTIQFKRMLFNMSLHMYAFMLNVHIKIHV